MEEGGGDFTQDGTVSLKGKPILRSKTGGWTACSFLVVYELVERMAFYGVSANLVVYLTTQLHQGTVVSSNNVTNWGGAVWMTPILGAYIADTYLGRFWTFLISSIIYLLGMCLLTLTVSVPGLKPPPCHQGNEMQCKKASTLQLAMFYIALYTIAIGAGGTKPNISTIGAEQFDEFEPKERAKKLSFFNWWLLSVVVGNFLATTVIVYIQDNAGWSLGFGLPTAALAISILVFIVGAPFYRHSKLSAGGSPFTRMALVLVAAIRKRRVHCPSDPKQLHEFDTEEYAAQGKYRIESTPSLRFLNKAAIRTGSSTDPPCTVTQVEETKQMLRMIPILIATFIPNATLGLVNTLFVKQALTLDRNLKSFKMPAASLGGIIALTMFVSQILYNRFFVKFMRKRTGNPRGITLLQRMGIGICIQILAILTASLTEMRRLKAAKEYGVVETGGIVPLSVVILVPQFVLLGVCDAFYVVSYFEFFYDQAPESMKSIGASYPTTSTGVGSFLSSFLLSVVSDITKRNNGKGWVQNNLNASRIDYYYAFYAALSFLNLIFFMVVSRYHVYREETSDPAHKDREEMRNLETQKSIPM